MQAEDDVDVVRLPGGPPRQPRPQWQDVTVPDVNEAAAPPEPRGYANIHARPVSAARHQVSDEERRRVWEENQAAARRNRAQVRPSGLRLVSSKTQSSHIRNPGALRQ